MSGPRAGAHDERRIAWSANSRTLPPRVGTDEIASRAGRHGAGRSAGRNHRLPCVTTPPHAPVWWLLRPRPLLRTPERSLSRLEARRGPSSPPRHAPKVEDFLPMVFFLSFDHQVHEVTPVTQGIRESLTWWVPGDVQHLGGGKDEL